MKCVYMPIKYLINRYEETNMTGCVSIMSVFQDKIFWITDGVKFWMASCSGGNFSSMILVFFLITVIDFDGFLRKFWYQFKVPLTSFKKEESFGCWSLISKYLLM